MSSPRSGLDSVLADALAELANRSLDLDPASRARLTALEGRQLQITVELPPSLRPRDFALVVSAGRLRFLPHAPERPNVILRGSPPDLAGALFSGMAGGMVGGMAGGMAGGERGPGSRLQIDGDGSVLTELNAALRAFRPDLGSPLSRVLGAEFAQAALGTVELAIAALRSAFEGAGHAAREGAARTFVDRPQAERFLDGLDELRLRIDRLAARVQAQEQRRTPP
jgi:ubiquinone biosynthesis protein UbiJ